jgi:hypothetical protein
MVAAIAASGNPDAVETMFLCRRGLDQLFDSVTLSHARAACFALRSSKTSRLLHYTSQIFFGKRFPY